MGLIDSTEVVRQFLSDADGALYAHLGGPFVAGPVAPPGFRNEDAAVIFHPETEGSHISASDNLTTFAFKCYGGSASYEDARGVYRALYDMLHNARQETTSEGTLVLAYLITAFQGPPEPETGWPVMVAKFGIVTR